MTEPEHVRDLLSRAGFIDIEIDAAVEPMWLGGDATDTIAFLRQTEMAQTLMAEADSPAVDRAWQAIAEVLAPHQTHAGVALNGAAWIVTTRRP